ncbi:MAG: hypothetical protein NC310_01395 [Roseburia sp.]|nr:hypothetical protein [Roseburia sp.]
MREKRIIMTCLVFLLCTFIIGIFIFSQKEHAVKPSRLKIASSVKTQIQSVENFRLDKIVIDVQFGENYHQNMVVEESMISSEDLQKLAMVGMHRITIHYLNLNLFLDIVLYDEEYLEKQYIYYYIDEEIPIIFTSRSILESPVPYKNGYFFCGWYDSSNKNHLYSDNENKIVQLYPHWSRDKVYKIDFYLHDEIIERQYVTETEPIIYPTIEEEFYCWDHNDTFAKNNLDVFAICPKENQVVVRFYTKERALFSYRIVSIGESIEEPPTLLEDGLEFYSWNQSLINIKCSLDCYPIYYEKDTLFQVNFYSIENELLETQNVSYGQPAKEYELDSELYYVAGYSKSIDSIICDMDVIVYFQPYVYLYYDEDRIYSSGLSTQAQPNPPSKVGYTGYWRRQEGSKTNFELYYRRNGEYFYITTMDDGKMYKFYYPEEDAETLSCRLALEKDYYVHYTFYDNVAMDHEFSFPSSTPDVYLYAVPSLPDEKVEGTYTQYIETNSFGAILTSIFLGKSTVYLELANCYYYLIDQYPIDQEKYQLIPIVGVDFRAIKEYQYILIGEDILYLEGLTDIEDSKIKYILVSKDNPNFYSKDGNLYDKKNE